jgi:alkylation response protein AidB-like acyl-CoA dehydrogenase
MDATAAKALAKKIADEVLAPSAARNDKEARFSKEAIEALGKAGLLGLTVAKEHGGLGLGPRAFAGVVSALAEADASVAMVYVMHVNGTACIQAAPKSAKVASILQDIAKGTHLTTLAFSEKGSRSHFWAPISKAQKTGGGARITAQKSFVTSAGNAQSYVVTTLAHGGKGPTDSTLYLVLGTDRAMRVASPWDGMGLRGNASAPMTLEAVDVPDELRLTEECGGFKAKLEVVLPLFNLGSACVSLGLCRATTGAAIAHLKTATFEHLGAKLGEALPTLRAQLAQMQIDTDGLAARIDDCVAHLEQPNDATMLRVLEVKTAAGDAAIKVTSEAMHTCGGAAFSRHTSIERFFRDAHAGSVMAPTGDQLRDFIGKALLGIPLF